MMEVELPFQFRKCMHFLTGGTMLRQLSSFRMLFPGRSGMFNQLFLCSLASWGELLLQPALNFLSMNIK